MSSVARSASVGSAPDAARVTAERLIQSCRFYSAEMPVALANHLPMLLEILCRLGASADRLEAYADFYLTTNRVPLLPPESAPISASGWQSALGDRTREADYRRFFLAEVARLGASATIRNTLPVLGRGIGASALHGLMRLAYGVLRQDDSEIGIALGYWAATWLPLPDEPAGPPDLDDPLAPFLLMQTMPSFRGITVETDLLWHWMRAVGQQPEFAPLIGRLLLNADAIDRVAGSALTLYASTMSFEALHALTGCHWVRLVSPHADDPAALLRSFWQAILAVYPKIGMPTPLPSDALRELRALTVPPLEAIKEAAIASDDEHDPSLVYSAIEEHARSGDPLYLVLAAKRVGLLA